MLSRPLDESLEVKFEKVDKYSQQILIQRYNMFIEWHKKTQEIIDTTGLPIRHQNLSEDISENIIKFIIINYDNDISCKWSKAINKNGDLCSDKYTMIEVKSFTSCGPTSFGPRKKFDVLYFLDMRKHTQECIILWRLNLSSESAEWKNLKMSKKQTIEDQCHEGRRPRIGWDCIYSQLQKFCSKVYEGSFANIFIQRS